MKKIRAITTAMAAMAAIAVFSQDPALQDPCPTSEPMQTIVPSPLKPGARIAIVTPSSSVDSAYITQGIETLRQWGYEPIAAEHAYGKACGSYAASDSLRAQDLMRAFADPQIDAILCARGGYGATRILPLLDPETILANPKWLIGFSDITAIHALLNGLGLASIHGPMCSQLAKRPDDESTLSLRQMLAGRIDAYDFPTDPLSKPGLASGKLLGGNMIVANNLAQTPYDIFDTDDEEGVILFIEEVGERIYAVERMLLRLHQSGILDKVNGIVFGEFTSYKPDDDFASMEEMLRHRLAEWGYINKEGLPIAFRFPAGHGDINYPIILGARATLSIDPESTTLQFCQ